jgi:hypothetical protein
MSIDECGSANLSIFTHCRILNISQRQPEWLAIPLYGYAFPIIVAITFATNSLVILILSNRNLRTPTNHVLLAMALAELMTGRCTIIIIWPPVDEPIILSGLSSAPFFVYYYTLGGYVDDRQHGLSPFWCHFHDHFARHLPTMYALICPWWCLILGLICRFHTAGIWLTVYLAIQRYIYVCVPRIVYRCCTPARTRRFIFGICIAALVSESPSLLFETSESIVSCATKLGIMSI